MDMARKFKELQAKMPREARAQRRGSQENDLRNGSCRTPRGQDLTQESPADTLHVNQASIPNMERRPDMYISSLIA